MNVNKNGKFRLAFLVYDSRSGSTILSKALSRRLAGLTVTPEIAFDDLLGRRAIPALHQSEPCERIVINRLERALRSGALRHLAPEQDVAVLIKQTGVADTKALIESLVWLHLQNGGSDSTVLTRPNDDDNLTVLVKNGSHLKYLDQITTLFGNTTPVVFLHRDPRDVIASKCVTRRPYAQHEVMAWGGVFLAAIRWHRYASLALRAKRKGKRILFVSYDAFVEGPDTVIGEIKQFLNIEYVPSASGSDYAVPVAEQSIHKLAMQGEVVTTRQNRWRETLLRREVIAVEFVCKSTMSKLGYVPAYQARGFELVFSVVRAFAESMIKTTGRYVRRVLVNRS